MASNDDRRGAHKRRLSRSTALAPTLTPTAPKDAANSTTGLYHRPQPSNSAQLAPTANGSATASTPFLTPDISPLRPTIPLTTSYSQSPKSTPLPSPKILDDTPRFLGMPLKYVSLITLAVQNAALIIVMHYSRVSVSADKKYSAGSAVLMTELLKGSTSLLIAVSNADNHSPHQNGILDSATASTSSQAPVSSSPTPSHHKARKRSDSGSSSKSYASMFSLYRYIPHRFVASYDAYLGATQTWIRRARKTQKDVLSPDCWKLSIPAILYVIQNNLQFVAASNLDVATFQVTYQMKILTTAAFSVLLLRKKLSVRKWGSLILLAIGVGIVQVQAGSSHHGGGHSDGGTHESHPHQILPPRPGAWNVSDAARNMSDHHAIIRNVSTLNGSIAAAQAAAEALLKAHGADEVEMEMSPLKGFLAVSAACLTSGLAGVYFEMVLKGSKADLWVRNVQLSLFSLLPAVAPVLFSSPAAPVASGWSISNLLFGWLRNFGFWAWATVAIQVAGGLITAIVIKYSDNILKGFATSLSIVISFMASVLLFDFDITWSFVIGAMVVLGATAAYNQPDPKPPLVSTGTGSSSAIGGGGGLASTLSKVASSVSLGGLKSGASWQEKRSPTVPDSAGSSSSQAAAAASSERRSSGGSIGALGLTLQSFIPGSTKSSERLSMHDKRITSPITPNAPILGFGAAGSSGAYPVGGRLPSIDESRNHQHSRSASLASLKNFAASLGLGGVAGGKSSSSSDSRRVSLERDDAAEYERSFETASSGGGQSRRVSNQSEDGGSWIIPATSVSGTSTPAISVGMSPANSNSSAPNRSNLGVTHYSSGAGSGLTPPYPPPPPGRFYLDTPSNAGSVSSSRVPSSEHFRAPAPPQANSNVAAYLATPPPPTSSSASSSPMGQTPSRPSMLTPAGYQNRAPSLRNINASLSSISLGSHSHGSSRNASPMPSRTISFNHSTDVD